VRVSCVGACQFIEMCTDRSTSRSEPSFHGILFGRSPTPDTAQVSLGMCDVVCIWGGGVQAVAGFEEAVLGRVVVDARRQPHHTERPHRIAELEWNSAI
jgi:hypothetical protein